MPKPIKLKLFECNYCAYESYDKSEYMEHIKAADHGKILNKHQKPLNKYKK